MELILSRIFVLILVANHVCRISGHVRYQRNTTDTEEGTTPAPNAKNDDGINLQYHYMQLMQCL